MSPCAQYLWGFILHRSLVLYVICIASQENLCWTILYLKTNVI